MTARLPGKVAIVTGAAQGIGRAIALALARAGSDVVAADLNLAGAEAVAGECRALGRRALAAGCDVAEAEQVSALVERALAGFGHIDILVNNAGIQIRARVTEMRLEDWDRTLAVNLRGCFLCTRAVLPHMLGRGAGHIINISSDSGKHGWPTGSAYCASKFGILGFTEAVAAEVMHAGVHVNAICPGGVVTAMSDHKTTADGKPYDRSNYLQPEDVAEVVVFLASDAARAFYGAALDAWGRAR
jgi:NAD(P)-dependent dehydrogenase (short-subunit alcohol dehydrogenase family)